MKVYTCYYGIVPTGMHETERPWLKPHAAMPPAAADPAPGDNRKRPLIFVHELPGDYHSRMLQYRIQHKSCVHRCMQTGWCHRKVQGISKGCRSGMMGSRSSCLAYGLPSHCSRQLDGSCCA